MLQRLKKAVTRTDGLGPGPFEYRQGPLDTGNRQWFLVALLLVGCSAALSAPWLLGFVTIPWDAKAHFQAQIAFLAQSIHSGQSPFWTPYVFGGHPQIADPQSLVFSPGYLLLALLTPNPTFAMVDGIVFAKLTFGALGVLGFARDRRWHPAAAIVAALAFAFGGSAAWRVQHVGQILSLAYFPWAIWMLERGLRLSSARYGALAGFFAAMVVLGPDQVAYLVLVALAAFSLAHLMSGPGRLARLRASLRPLTAGAIVGAAIIAVPILMVLTFADGSNRAHIDLEEAALGSLHPTSMLTFVIANLFGTIGPSEQFWGAPSIHWPYIVKSYIARNMSNFYMGILPLMGIVAWLASRAAYTRRIVVLPVLFALMLAYALGSYTPVFPTLYHMLPGSDLFRRPADATFVAGAFGALLAGFGLDALLRRPPSRQYWIAFGALMTLAFAGGTGMAIWLGMLGKAGPELLTALASLLITLAVFGYAIVHAREYPLGIAALLAVCLTADLAWNIRPNDSTGLPPLTYAKMDPGTDNETLALLKSRVQADESRRDRVELVGLGFEWPNISLVHKLENTLGYNPLRLSAYAAATGARDHAAGWDQRKFAPLFNGYRSPFANLLGLRFIASGVPLEQIDKTLEGNPLPLIARTSDGYIYENPDALPRVMIVPEAQPLDQDTLIRTGAWPSTDLRRVVFVEPSAIPLPRRARGGMARITHYENTRVEIEVSAVRGGVLLLNDIWHPWWFAEIDGKPAKILRANGVFRAVILPDSAKRVVFQFEPMRGLVRRYLLKGGLIAARPATE